MNIMGIPWKELGEMANEWSELVENLFYNNGQKIEAESAVQDVIS